MHNQQPLTVPLSQNGTKQISEQQIAPKKTTAKNWRHRIDLFFLEINSLRPLKPLS